MAQKQAVVDYKINGSQSVPFMKEMEKRVKLLKQEWKNAKTEAEAYKKAAEFRQANEQLRQHRRHLYEVDSAWERFKKTAMPISQGILGANLVQAGVGLITRVIPGIVGGAAEIDDQLADIRKNSGLLKSEVRELDAELRKLNTRTSREELRALAAEAGKLGKSTKEDIMEFVREADMINVALGDALGEEATASIGKIAGVFETSMLKIGSAVNTVGANSQANEGYLVDFLARLGGSAKTVDISAASVLGYGAVLDSLGLQVEMSSTALSNFFIDFVKDTGKFETAAGIQRGELRKLIGEKGANEGFLYFIETLKATSKSEAEFLQKLDEIDIDGSRGAAVFLSLANNTQMVREQQDLANKAYTEGTSIIEEFNIKSNNTAGIWDKIGKSISSWMSSDGVKGTVDAITIGFGKFFGVITDIDIKISEFTEKRGEVAKLEKSVIPLIDRYEQLKTQTTLTSDEQNELKIIISEIASAVPSAVTQFDQYGNALDIAASNARNFVSEQQAILRLLEKDTFDTASKQVDKYNKTIWSLNTQINSGTLSSRELEVRNKQLQKNIQERWKLAESLQAAGIDVLGISPTTAPVTWSENGFFGPSPSTPGTKDPVKPKTPITGDTYRPSKSEETAAKKAQKALEDRLAKQRAALAAYREEQYLADQTAADREIIQVMQKWDKIIEETGAKGEELKEMYRLQDEEINKVTTEQNLKGIENSIVQAEKLLAQHHQAKMFALEIQAASETQSQGTTNMLKLQAEQEYINQQISLKMMYGESVADLETQLTENLHNQQLARLEMQLQAEKSFADERKSILESLSEAELDLAETKQFALQDGLSTLQSIFAQSSGMYKALFLLEKAVAIAQIITTNQREVAALRLAQALNVAMASTNPISAATIPAINALYNAKILKSRIQAGVSVGMVAAQAVGQFTRKEKGGFTDPVTLGYTTGAAMYGGMSNPFIAGEKGTEFVTSFQSLQNPVVADFTRLLDTAQKTGNYSQINNYSTSQSFDTEKILGALKMLNSGLDKLSKRPIAFNFNSFEKYQDFINEIRSSVTA